MNSLFGWVFMAEEINLSFDGVKAARHHLSRIFDETPILPLAVKDVDGRKVTVHGKLESAQATYSFKSRGAEFFVHNRVREQQKGGRKKPILVTASAGNHAQGVALAAKRWGLDAHIFMPTTTPQVKRGRTEEKLGGIVHLVGDYFDQALSAALEYSEPRGRVFVPPYKHRDIIHGQGTVAMEMLSRVCPYHSFYWRFYDYFSEHPWVVPDVVIAPVGGGGLATGMGIVIRDFTKHTGHDIKLVGVQSENADSMYRSFHSGKLLPSSNTMPSIADGIYVKQASEEMLGFVRTYVDDIVLVSEGEIQEAMRSLRYNPSLNRQKQWYHSERSIPERVLSYNEEAFSVDRPLNRHEGASAASYAGVDKLDYGKLGIDKEFVRVMCVLTGSNIDSERFDALTS